MNQEKNQKLLNEAWTRMKLAQTSSLSPNTWRRSECPRTTQVHPTSLIIATLQRETAPLAGKTLRGNGKGKLCTVRFPTPMPAQPAWHVFPWSSSQPFHRTPFPLLGGDSHPWRHWAREESSLTERQSDPRGTPVTPEWEDAVTVKLCVQDYKSTMSAAPSIMRSVCKVSNKLQE